MADEPILDLAWPIDFDSSGRVRTVEQNTIADVQMGVNLRLRTRRGSMPFAPDFGRPGLVFDTDPEEEIRAMIEDPENGAVRVGSYDLIVGDDNRSFEVVVKSVNTFPESA